MIEYISTYSVRILCIRKSIKMCIYIEDTEHVCGECLKCRSFATILVHTHTDEISKVYKSVAILLTIWLHQSSSGLELVSWQRESELCWLWYWWLWRRGMGRGAPLVAHSDCVRVCVCEREREREQREREILSWISKCYSRTLGLWTDFQAASVAALSPFLTNNTSNTRAHRYTG